jgi:hypothetical protein
LLAELVRWVGPWWRFRRRLRHRTGRRLDLAKIKATDGHMTGAECERLYDLARAADGGCIVEIGSFRGRSTVACALGARAGRGARVYAVDPFVPFVGLCGGRVEPGDKTHLLRNLLLAGIADEVWLIHAPSAQAAEGWQEPVALLWIDGDHSYAAVREDVDSWARYVVRGGVLAFHDSTDPALGASRVVGELLAQGRFERCDRVDTLTVLRKF